MFVATHGQGVKLCLRNYAQVKIENHGCSAFSHLLEKKQTAVKIRHMSWGPNGFITFFICCVFMGILNNTVAPDEITHYCPNCGN